MFSPYACMKPYKTREEIFSAQRPKREKKKKMVWFFAGALFFVFALFLTLSYVVLNADMFRVESIKVSGARLTPHQKVISSFIAEAIRDRKWLSVLGPDNILFWICAPEETFFPYVPTIRKVSQDVDFGEKKVFITTDERSVVNVVCASSGECYGMDENGFIFSPVPEVRGSLILRFEADSSDSPAIGKQYLPSAEWIQNISDTLLLMKKEGFVPKVVRVRRSGVEEWEAVMPEGFSFFFSLHFVPDRLDSVLKDISARAKLDVVQYFDFRVRNRMFYK